MDRSCRQKINKYIVELNSTINQLDIMNIYILFHPKTAEYTFFSSSHRRFTKIDHIWGHKIHLNKFKSREIIQYQLSDHNGFKVEVNNRKTAGKFQTT